jgi:hypothetical protein
MKQVLLAAAVCTCLFTGAGTVARGSQPLTLQVSPTMTAAPAFIRVRALVESNDDNRSLEIVAQSPQFFRSSTVDLDGRNAPPLTVIEYPNMPPGFYDVTAVLVGASGKRVTETRYVKVVAMAGS